MKKTFRKILCSLIATIMIFAAPASASAFEAPQTLSGSYEYEFTVDAGDASGEFCFCRTDGKNGYFALTSEKELTGLKPLHSGDAIESISLSDLGPENFEELGANYVYVFDLVINPNHSAGHTVSEFKIAYDGGTTADFTYINDAFFVSEEEIRYCAEEDYPAEIGGRGYSSYICETTGEKIYCKSGAYSVSAAAFGMIEGSKASFIMQNDPITVTVDSVESGQKGICFCYGITETGGTNPSITLDFYDETPILGQKSVMWEMDYTYGEIREFFGLPEDGGTYTYYVLRDGKVIQEITVDYSVMDPDILVMLFLRTTDEKLGSCSLCVSAGPAVQEIASGFCGGEGDGTNLEWTVTDDGTITISGEGGMADYEYSSAPWADYAESIGTLVIEEGVTTIGEYAFWNYGDITGELVFPESLTSIGNYSFDGCDGFSGDLVIPEGVTFIGDYAFFDCCGFTGDLVIPEGVTSVGNYAFGYCKGFGGVLLLPESLTSIGNNAFWSCSGLIGDLIIPEGITSLGRSVFSGCSGFNGKLVLPESLTSIGNYAFNNCSGLRGGLVIPEGVTSIGNNSFYNCMSFSGEAVIPEGVKTVGAGAFLNCGINDYYFEGNAPVLVDETQNPAFDEEDTLYYCAGKSGWETDENGLWNGFVISVWEAPAVSGDANGDGNVTSRDATRILQYLIGSVDENSIDIAAADYNGDGNVTSRDATAILRYLIGG